MATLKERIDAARAAQPAASAPQEEKDAWYEDFGEGVVASGLGTVYGIKDLFVGLTDKEKARLKDWSDDAAESGWGTAGKIAGEIAQIVGTGGAIGTAAKGLSKARYLGKAAKALQKSPILKDVTAAAAVGAAKTPEEGSSRLTRAAIEAGAAGTGGLLLKGAGKLARGAIKGVKRTPEAQQLIKEGVPLTVGQAADSPLINVIETTTQKSAPLRTTAIGKQKELAQGVWRTNVFKKALPEGYSPDRITATKGTEAFRQVKSVFDDAYDDAWAGSTGLTSETTRGLSEGIDEVAKGFRPEDAAILQKVGRTVNKFTKKRAKSGKTVFADASPAQLKQIDEAISDAVAKAKDNPKLLDELEGFRWLIRDSLPEESLAKLTIADRAYPNKLALQKAVASANKVGGDFTPTQLATASRSVGRPARTARGKAPFQPDVERAGVTIGKPVAPTPEGMAGFLLKSGVNINPLSSDLTRRLGLGLTFPQRAAGAVYDPLSAALRRTGVTGGKVSAGLVEEGGY